MPPFYTKNIVAGLIVARLESEINRTLPIRALFEAADIKALALILEQQSLMAAGPALEPVDRNEPIPLSFSQERLWFVEQLDPLASDAYRIEGAIELRGDLDIEALGVALNSVVDRHESLRTYFSLDNDNPIQMIATDAAALGFNLQVEEGSDLDETAFKAMVRDWFAVPYTLSNGPLFRASIFIASPERYVLAVGGHHSILDGWSVAILLQETATFYRAYQQGTTAQLPPLPVQYADFSVWQRQAMDDDWLLQEREWWRDTLAGAPPAITLPTDRPRPEVMDYQAAAVDVHIPKAIVDGLNRLAQAENATLFVVLQAAFSAFLSRCGAGDDVVIGTAVANRSLTELEGLVGFFVNTLALRHKVDLELSFTEHLVNTREISLSTFEHQSVPFDVVVDAVQPIRTMKHAPLVQVMLVLQNVPGAADMLTLPDVEVVEFASGDGSAHFKEHFDLTLELAESEYGLEGQLKYAMQLFDRGTVENLVAHLLTFIDALVAKPDDLLGQFPLLNAEMNYQLLEGLSTRSEVLPECVLIPELIAAHAQHQAGAPAVIAPMEEDAQWLSYGDLLYQADQLAQVLRLKGLGEQSIVGICLDRKQSLPMAMLAVWRAGAALLPVNPEDPDERLRFMFDDAGVSLVIAEGGFADKLEALAIAEVLRLDTESETKTAANLPSPLTLAPEQLAYVIYTSGSTGKPKGVMVEHQAMAALRQAVIVDDPMAVEDGLISAFANSFDVFIRDVILPLSSGARLILAEPKKLAEPGYYADLVARFKANWLALTPTVWRAVVADGWLPSAHMRVETGGEALDMELAKLLTAKGERLCNAYGPTEVTMLSVAANLTAEHLDHKQPITIGRPLVGTRAYIVNEYQVPVPIGVPGELVLAGPQVARGYLNRPELTVQMFIDDPFYKDLFATEPVSEKLGSRAYRTGDLVRWRANGEIEFLGRIDDQIKIRGMRVELGEIESALMDLESIDQAVVLANKDASAQTVLLAYLVPAGQQAQDVRPQVLTLDDTIDLNQLRSQLQHALPEHMVPSGFIGLDQLPLTASGKTDRRALPKVEPETASAPYEAPEGEVEQALAAAMEELLDVQQVGRHDNFFALGGHSLLAVRLAAKLALETGQNLPVRALFEAPDLKALAALIVASSEQDEDEYTLGLVREDIALAEDLPQPVRGEQVTIERAEKILLTGATGFLGRYLLQDLLNRTQAKIVCLLRGESETSAQARLFEKLMEIPQGQLPENWQQRLTIVIGDFTHDGLGLDISVFKKLASEVDFILHNGAEVSTARPYNLLPRPQQRILFSLQRRI